MLFSAYIVYLHIHTNINSKQQLVKVFNLKKSYHFKFYLIFLWRETDRTTNQRNACTISWCLPVQLKYILQSFFNHRIFKFLFRTSFWVILSLLNSFNFSHFFPFSFSAVPTPNKHLQVSFSWTNLQNTVGYWDHNRPYLKNTRLLSDFRYPQRTIFTQQ